MKLNCLTLLTALVAICETLTAQSKLFVMDFTDTQTAYTLSNLRSITFSPGNMFVHKTSGISDQYSFSTVRYLSFMDFTTDVSQTVTGLTNLTVFPNPVTDRLSIQVNYMTNEPLRINICNLQGKAMCRQQVSASCLRQGISLDVLHYPAGVYLCRIEGKQSVSSVKFIKK